MNQITGFILAGGASSRMGRDKSQLLIDNQKFVDRIAETLMHIAGAITVVGKRSDNPQFGFTADVFPNWGALGGLHAALDNCNTEWALVVACDLPFVTDQLFRRLAEFRQNFDAVVPIQPDNRPQPLCAFYRKDPCLERARKLIESGKRRPLDLLESVRTRWVSFSELEQLERSASFFVNINTPADYDDATRTNPGVSES